jgi:hypothetical protein
MLRLDRPPLAVTMRFDVVEVLIESVARLGMYWYHPAGPQGGGQTLEISHRGVSRGVVEDEGHLGCFERAPLGSFR